MVVAHAILPDLSTLDADSLRALLMETHERYCTTAQRLQSRESEMEHLKLLLAKLQRMYFGRKSEKLQRQIEQLELRLEDLEQAQEVESEPAKDGQPAQPGMLLLGRRKPRDDGHCPVTCRE
jgi:predicted RecB family endonuclease